MKMSLPRKITRALGVVILMLGSVSIVLAQDAGLARTPPMGWNSWNHFACKVTEADVRSAADAIIANGMKAAGYIYVNIDDCWQGKRDEKGVLHPNEKFPDMKALADYVHGKGLKIGIYSSPGPKTCARYEGSFGHEEQDARMYADWGMDYLKFDYCSFKGDVNAQIAAYMKMHAALVKTGRSIVFSLCQYGMDRVWSWGPTVGGNLWRTTEDITDEYRSMAFIGFGQSGLERFAGPGHWNDPDMLEIGNGHMTQDEYLTHMSLWCILAAPLLAGNNLAKMTPETLEILTNPEVVAVDQDPAGIQGWRAAQEGPLEVWVKPLSDGSKAVGLFNRGESLMSATAHFRDIGVGEAASVRDLWAKRDLGVVRDHFIAEVPKHGVVLVKVK
ncbi:MAG: glycoside hydrolase family 27 protein [Terriglobia bacterium]|jgi:alpha-galactosidase